MARGDVTEVTAGDTDDLYCIDTGMYGLDEYGAVYVLASDRPAIVDTGVGTNYELILDGLADLGIAPTDLEVIAPTHVHLDHAGGAGYLARECPDATVYVYEAGAHHLIDPSRLWAGTKQAVGTRIEHYAEPVPVPEDRLVELEEGDSIDVGDRELAVHHAPGHAFHQAVFADPASDGVFAADAAGINLPRMDGPGPTSPPPDFDLEGCLADVDLLRDLDPGALYYGHFGGYETDDLLDQYERVLTDWIETVAETRAELGDDEAVTERLAARAESYYGDDGEMTRAEVVMNVKGALQYLDEREG